MNLPHDADTILERVDELRDLNNSHVLMRQVMKAVMDGGADAVAQIVPDSEMQYVPAANLIYSGIERVAQKLIHPPSVRVDAPMRGGSRARNGAEKRERIVESWDDTSNLKMQMPQAARWLAGYGFSTWAIDTSLSHDKQPYPDLQLRDPFGCLPGPWTVHQQPADIAFIRRVPEDTLRKTYPNLPRTLKKPRYSVGGAVILDNQFNSTWETQNNVQMHRVIEYRNDYGTFIVLEDSEIVLEFEPVPEGVGAPFVVAKRFAFNQLMGQFEHAIGLQQMMARMNILSFLSVQDAVFAETNVYGEMQSDEYRKGRSAVNMFSPGTRVEKLTDPGVFAAFQQQDRLERQARMTGAYPVTDDAQSPNSYVTGKGLDSLTAGSDNIVQEYQLVLGDALERADTKRLMWDEKAYGSVQRTLGGVHKGSPYSETYTPDKHIKGSHRTRRVYGLLSGLDSSSKLVGLLQISQAGWMDDITAMENLDGIDNVQLVRERMESQKASQLLEQAMLGMMQGQPADPRVLRILIDQLESGPVKKKYEEVFFPPEPEPEPGTEMLDEAGQPLPGGGDPLAAPGEDPTTIMTRMFAGGENVSSAQTTQTV